MIQSFKIIDKNTLILGNFMYNGSVDHTEKLINRTFLGSGGNCKLCYTQNTCGYYLKPTDTIKPPKNTENTIRYRVDIKMENGKFLFLYPQD